MELSVAEKKAEKLVNAAIAKIDGPKAVEFAKANHAVWVKFSARAIERGDSDKVPLNLVTVEGIQATILVYFIGL